MFEDQSRIKNRIFDLNYMLTVDSSKVFRNFETEIIKYKALREYLLLFESIFLETSTLGEYNFISEHR